MIRRNLLHRMMEPCKLPPLGYLDHPVEGKQNGRLDTKSLLHTNFNTEIAMYPNPTRTSHCMHGYANNVFVGNKWMLDYHVKV